MAEEKTNRSKEREREDRKSQMVVVKRIDQHRAHPSDTLDFAIEEGLGQIRRSWLSLFVSSVAAGLILGLATMAVAKMNYLAVDNGLSDFAVKLATALIYPLGFVVCILSGTQLFTEHTATAVYPYLDKKCTFKSLAKMLSLVALGNIVGTLVGAIMIYLANPVVQADAGYIYLGKHLLQYTSIEIFVSAVLAGWLMAQGGWLVLATRADIEKIFLIYIVTFIIGLCGLHHSIMGSAELFVANFFGFQQDWLSVLVALLVMLIGNLFGGSVFVALLNYAHIKKLDSK